MPITKFGGDIPQIVFVLIEHRNLLQNIYEISAFKFQIYVSKNIN